MRGTVEVVPATATDVPSQAEIDTRAQQELAALQTRLEQARGQGRQGRSEPGPITPSCGGSWQGTAWWTSTTAGCSSRSSCPRT